MKYESEFESMFLNSSDNIRLVLYFHHLSAVVLIELTSSST